MDGKPELFACKQQGHGPASASVKSGLRLSCLPCDQYITEHVTGTIVI